jgi:TolA-binding protein/LysM repeat protein
MKRLVALIVLILVLATAGVVTFAVIRTKQKREAELNAFYLCETRFQEGNYQDSARLLDTFVKEHPKSDKSGEAYYYLAMSHQKLGDYTAAMAAWDTIVKDHPRSLNLAEAHYYLGYGHQKQGDQEKAMDNYKIVVNRFSNLPVAGNAWYGMGVIYEKQGQEQAASNAYRNVMERYPTSEFNSDAERRWGNISLNRFLKDNVITYEVGRGDSLVKIAAKFGITPELIMRINGMTADMLQRGQILKVIDPDFNISVDLMNHKLYLKSGERIVKLYNVCTGKEETPTPTGEFKVTEKLPDPVWYSTSPSGVKEAIPPGDPRNELGTRWIGFKPAYGIHGTIEPDSIGTSVSHGCVRMLNGDVEELYDLVGVGTPVEIISESRQDDAIAQKQ